MVDVLKRLDDFIEYADKLKRYQDVGFYTQCKEEISRLKKVNQLEQSGQWISVNDRLPETKDVDGLFEKSENMIVLSAGDLDIALYQFGLEDGGWQNWYSPLYEDCIEQVTHWMLPSPPKEP